MKHKYTDNIGYLFKKDRTVNTETYSTEGIPFQYNKIMKKRNTFDAMSNTLIIN